ncbi:hypothetical protein ES703_98234 [subsurface metagenome]
MYIAIDIDLMVYWTTWNGSAFDTTMTRVSGNLDPIGKYESFMFTYEIYEEAEPPDASPNVTLNSPDNYANFSSTIPFNCTASDDINLINVSLYGNWSTEWHLNQTNDTGINADYIFTKNISDGTYVWNCKACDNKSQCEFADPNRTFTVDATAPSISITSVNDSSVSPSQEICINATVNDSGVGIDKVWAYITYPNGTQVNETMTDIGSGCGGEEFDDWYGVDFNVGSIQGTLTVNTTYANDTLGNWGNETSWPNLEVIVSDNPPTWSNNETNANDATKTQQSVYFNITLNDDIGGGYQIFAFYNGTDWGNDSTTAWSDGNELEEIRTITATRGQTVQWYWWFNDSEGQPNQTDVWNFTIANTAPTFDQNLTDQEVTTPNSLSYDVNCSDADPDNITYYVNNTIVSINSSTGLINDTTTAESETGYYSINVTCGDGYDNNSQSFNYTIKDGTAPSTSLVVPADNYWNDSAAFVDVNFTCNATDGYNLKNISLYITDSSNASFSLNSSRDITGTYNWSNWTLSLSVGDYTWNCLTYDEYNNSDWADDNRSLMINYTLPDAPRFQMIMA